MNYLAYITMPTEESAVDLARFLVRKKFCAGVNIVPGAFSVYRWQGEICEKRECLLLAQVSRDGFAAFQKAVLEKHAYVTPCVLALPIVDGNEQFLQWIRENTKNTGA